MHAEVRRAASAGELFLREPRADARNAAAPQPETARVIDLARVAAFQDRFGDLGVAMEAEILRDHECAPHFLGDLDDFGGFPGVERHRLFDQHVLASLQGVNGDPRVQMVRHGDGHRINVRLIQQVVVIGVRAGDFEAVGRLLEAFGVGFGDGHRGGAWTMQEAVKMFDAETACAYYRATKSFGHICWGATCWSWLTRCNAL